MRDLSRCALQLRGLSSASRFSAAAACAGRALRTQHWQQGCQRLLHVCLHGKVGAVVLAEFPAALRQVDHGKVFGQRLGRAVDRHAQQVCAEAEQQVIGLEQAAHLFLRARERAHAGRVLGGKLRAVGNWRLINRRAQQLGEFRGFGECIVRRELLPGEDYRAVRGKQHFREPCKRRIGRPGLRVHAHRASHVEFDRLIEHITRQADEDRAGWRRQRDLGGAVQDAGQVLGARHVDGPLDHGLRDRHQRIVEQRFEQAMSLLLLARGQDDRRTREPGVVKRAHRVAKPGGDVHVGRGEPARRATEPIGHRHDNGLMQAEDKLQLREIGHHFHDRKFGGSRVAEKVRDPFVDEQLQESRAARRTARLHSLARVGNDLLLLLAQAADSQRHDIARLEEHRIRLHAQADARRRAGVMTSPGSSVM